MSYTRGSSDIWRWSHRRRARALDFSDRRLFPIW